MLTIVFGEGNWPFLLNQSGNIFAGPLHTYTSVNTEDRTCSLHSHPFHMIYQKFLIFVYCKIIFFHFVVAKFQAPLLKLKPAWFSELYSNKTKTDSVITRWALRLQKDGEMKPQLASLHGNWNSLIMAFLHNHKKIFRTVSMLHFNIIIHYEHYASILIKRAWHISSVTIIHTCYWALQFTFTSSKAMRIPC